jgi:very-short-patch-repair endonuclease/predicted transcriptional regulator of viral defense system
VPEPSPRPDAAPPSARRSTDALIEALAAEQHGIVTRVQLIRRGVAAHLVDLRVRTRVLRRVHAGVYRVGPLISAREREMAAVLACSGPGVQGGAVLQTPEHLAVVGQRGAAAAHELLLPQPRSEPVDVVVPLSMNRGRRRGIRSHRIDLRPEEVVRIEGIPFTTVARTLVDLAGCTTSAELERAFSAAARRGLTDGDAVSSILRRNPNCRGAARLQALLGCADEVPFTRSAAEDAFLTLVRAGGLPGPRTNILVHGFEVDFFWQQARLVVEIDGFVHHRARRTFVRDRQRNSALAAAGIQMLRLSWDQVVIERDRTLVQVAQVLARST